MKRKIQLVAMICTLPVIVAGCGGGGSDTPVTSTTLSGTVVDAAVAGLNYSCAPSSLSGTTAADGSYSYKAGDTCSFAIGSITIGSAPADGVVSPVDFVTGGSSVNAAVTNIVQTLMMLDADGDPANGITLDPVTVSDFVAATPVVDFASLTFDADMAPVATALGKVLSSDAAAQAHLVSSLRCAYSGAYAGSYSGSNGTFSNTGNWGLVVDPVTGGMIGASYDNILQQVFPLQANAELALDQNRAFAAGTGGPGVQFSGNLDTFYLVNGTWAGDVGTPAEGFSGTFTGDRYAVSTIVEPAFRFVGGYTGTASGFFAMDVDGLNHVVGQAYNPAGDVVTPLTGSYDPTTGAVTLTSADGISAPGNYNAATQVFSGTWSGGTDFGTYAGHGCAM